VAAGGARGALLSDVAAGYGPVVAPVRITVTPHLFDGGMTGQQQITQVKDQRGPTHRWHLDEATRASGRRGLAKARAALADARKRSHDQHADAA
jgi:hypothetical protein